MPGDGGDLLPYMFRKMEIGPLVGIWGVPPLIDGGRITVPRGGFSNTDGEWAVVNEGVAPDIEVKMTPRLVEGSRDPQLERAVDEAVGLLETQDVELLEEPPPIRSRRPADNGN